MKLNKFSEKIYFRLPIVLQNIALNLYGYCQARQRFGGRFLHMLEELEKTQWWSCTELGDLQNELLQKLIKHAYENVPYYNCVFKESSSPGI